MDGHKEEKTQIQFIKYGVELQIQENKSFTSYLGPLLVNLITLPMFSPISRSLHIKSIIFYFLNFKQDSGLIDVFHN